jgi:hypothetical protein
MKRIIILCLSIFFATNSMALEGSVSFDMENGTKSINKTPTLYNFSKQLLLASENCSPYTENFTELNPELGKLGAMFGGELSVQIDIKGKQEEKCVFEVIMQLGLLGQQIQHCQISDDQRERLLIAMKDRSNEVITETFDSYIITKDANENIIDKQTYKTTMTDNRFNIEWAKIVQECDITQKELSEEDKAEQQKDFNTFDDKFLESLRLCQNDITSRQVLFLSEDIEIKGLKDGKCIIEYKDFIIHLPQEKLESIQSWENISELIKDKAISEYNYEQNYDYSNLLFAIDTCIKQDGSNGETIQSNEELKIIKSLEYKKITDGCEIAFVNILNRGSEEENYTKICKLPESYIQDIKKEHSTLIEQYGAKSGVDEKGHFYFQSAKSNEETKNADEKIWLEIRENNFCNLLNNHIKAHSL